MPSYSSAINKIGDMRQDLSRGDQVCLYMHAMEFAVRLDRNPIGGAVVLMCSESYKAKTITPEAALSISSELDSIEKFLTAALPSP